MHDAEQPVGRLAALGRELLLAGDLDRGLAGVAASLAEELGAPFAAILDAPYEDGEAIVRAASDGAGVAAGTVVRPAALLAGGGVSVPLSAGQRDLGTLVVGAGLDAERRAFATAAADLVAAAIALRESALGDQMRSAGRLAAGMAHDLNGLLGVIANFAQLAASDVPAGGQLAEDLEQIRLAAREAADLTRQLSVIAGDRIVHPEPLSLETFLDAFELPDGLTIAASLRARRAVHMAEQDLRALLSHVLANAAAAMPGGGTVAVSADDGERAGAPVVVVTIRDSGAGMTPEVLERAFDPYYSTWRGGRGAGVGLPTAFGLLKSSGGELELRTFDGAGTTVRLFLPAAPEE